MGYHVIREQVPNSQTPLPYVTTPYVSESPPETSTSSSRSSITGSGTTTAMPSTNSTQPKQLSDTGMSLSDIISLGIGVPCGISWGGGVSGLEAIQEEREIVVIPECWIASPFKVR